MVKDAMIARGLTTGKASRVKKHKGIKDLLEHLLRVRCIAYQIVRDIAYNEVRKAIFVVSSKSRTLYRVREDQNSACLTNFGTYYFVVVFLFFATKMLNNLCFLLSLLHFSDAFAIGRR
jgi:hypothetical protein